MQKINCYLSDEIKNYYLKENRYYHMLDVKQFFEYFLPKDINVSLNNDFNNSDIFFWNMQLENNFILNEKKINILISIENINYWGKEMKKLDWPGYIHFSKYNDFDDEKIDIFYYNHINKIIENEKYVAIPMIYIYINYYLNNKNLIKPLNNTSFNDKKFCLVINKSNLNKDIQIYTNLLKNIDDVDNIIIYKDIETKSCYHSSELITIFNKYKFILCIENSIGEGYITEKIFNCFFAKSIPIFIGTNDINLFINKECFINGIENNLLLIKEINCNETLYYKYIYSNKIIDNYNNENYIDKIYKKIYKKIN